MVTREDANGYIRVKTTTLVLPGPTQGWIYGWDAQGAWQEKRTFILVSVTVREETFFAVGCPDYEHSTLELRVPSDRHGPYDLREGDEFPVTRFYSPCGKGDEDWFSDLMIAWTEEQLTQALLEAEQDWKRRVVDGVVGARTAPPQTEV